jgi:hypothetical protein
MSDRYAGSRATYLRNILRAWKAEQKLLEYEVSIPQS